MNKGAEALPCNDFTTESGRANCAGALERYQDQGNVVGSCGYCRKLFQLLHGTRQAMESAALQRNPQYTVQEANSKLDQMMTQGFATASDGVSVSNDLLGPCELVCSSVLVKGVSQDQTFSLNTTVTVDTTQVNTIIQQMAGKLASQIENKQDFPGQVLDSLFGNRLEVETNITSILEANIDERVVNQFLVEAKNQQQISVYGDSIYASNLKQSFSSTMVNEFRVLTNISDEVKQSSDFSISTLIKNENDTIGAIVNTIIGTLQVISKAVTDITTSIVICIVAIVITAILVVTAKAIFSPSFAANIESKLNEPKASASSTASATQVKT